MTVTVDSAARIRCRVDFERPSQSEFVRGSREVEAHDVDARVQLVRDPGSDRVHRCLVGRVGVALGVEEQVARPDRACPAGEDGGALRESRRREVGMGRPTSDDRLDAGQPRRAAQEHERDATVIELDESRLVTLGRAIRRPGRALVHVPAGWPDGPLVPLRRGDRGDPEARDAASGYGALSAGLAHRRWSAARTTSTVICSSARRMSRL